MWLPQMCFKTYESLNHDRKRALNNKRVSLKPHVGKVLTKHQVNR